MSVWMKNLRMALENKPVVVLHGNVRDRYVDEQRRVFDNLSSLLTELCRTHRIPFAEMLVCDPRGEEKTIPLQAAPPVPPPRATANELDDTRPMTAAPAPGSNRERVPAARLLAGWERKLKDPTVNRFAVLFYLDKLVPFGSPTAARIGWMFSGSKRLSRTSGRIIDWCWSLSATAWSPPSCITKVRVAGWWQFRCRTRRTGRGISNIGSARTTSGN